MNKDNFFNNLSNAAAKLQDYIVKTDLPFDLGAIKAKINLTKIREDIIELIQKAIKNIGNEQEREEVINWFIAARKVLEKNIPNTDKARELYSSVDSVKTAKIFFASLSKILKKYMDSSFPLPIKVALPITAIATLLLGAEGAGIAAFGGAIGLPVIAIFLIGSAGITAILEPFLKKNTSNEAKVIVSAAISALALLTIKSKITKEMKQILEKEATEPKRQVLTGDDKNLKIKLQSMDPFVFERHVMSFFQASGLKAAATKATSDFGIDGWVVHEKGLIVVQCKRNKDENKVGRPDIQRFTGAIEDQKNKGSEIYKGVFVTTSTFTEEAKESATLNNALILVDITDLLNWHKDGLNFESFILKF